MVPSLDLNSKLRLQTRKSSKIFTKLKFKKLIWVDKSKPNIYTLAFCLIDARQIVDSNHRNYCHGIVDYHRLDYHSLDYCNSGCNSGCNPGYCNLGQNLAGCNNHPMMIGCK